MKMFWVWEEIHRGITWRHHIDIHEWHYIVDCELMHPSDPVGILMDVMHDFHKGTTFLLYCLVNPNTLFILLLSFLLILI